MSEYSEKLRDPRWQRKRLEVLNIKDFRCEGCGSKEKTLNVHHKAYKKGLDPWEYTTNDLLVYCEDCHNDVHEIEQEIKKAVATHSIRWKKRILGYINSLSSKDNPLPVPKMEGDLFYMVGFSDSTVMPIGSFGASFEKDTNGRYYPEYIFNSEKA